MKPIMIIAGGTGFLGQALVDYFRFEYQIRVLTRRKELQNRDVSFHLWDGKTLGAWTSAIEGAQIIINLSGKSVDCRYTDRNKKEIYASRINSTRVLGEAIEACANPPEVWLNAASATIYPESFEKNMEESFTAFSDDFSVDVCKKWEHTFQEADLKKTRRITLRTGLVLGNGGGPLIPLKSLARIGLGGRQGSGRQYCSWLHEQDFCRAIEFLINQKEAIGVFNVTSPNPIPNKRLMNVLRKATGFPFGIPIPKLVLEAGAIIIRTETELICKSRKVVPARLVSLGFTFRFPRIEFAMYDLVSPKKNLI